MDRPAAPALRPYNRGLGVARLVTIFAVVIGLVLLARPRPAAVAAGALLATLGESIRIWAAGHLHKTVELITSGPYRYTRNPLYLGRLLIFTGLAVAAELPGHANWGVLLVFWAVFFGYYLPRKERVEPERLLAVHGEPYARYRASVPALWPRSSPYSEGSTDRWRRDRAARNREHWMVAGLLAAFVVLGLRAGGFI